MKLGSILTVAFLSSLGGFSNAFTPVSFSRRTSTAFVTSTSKLQSEPSDTGSDPFYDNNNDKLNMAASDGEDDDALTVESEEFAPTQTESLVTNVFDLLPTALGEVSESERATINEVLLKLEALNPTKEPTTSPLLNGVWELRYAAGYSSEGVLPSPTRQLALFLYSGGYSPGLFALGLAQKLPSNFVDVGDLEISICREQPRIEAKVNVKSMLFGESAVTVQARLETESGVRLRETYECATVMDRDIELPEVFQYSRELYITYLDEDILVVRDASGVPELLVRKEKTFSNNWGTDPSDIDDTVSPGEETKTPW